MGDYYRINAEEIRNKFREKCKYRIKIYNKLLEKCYYRINIAANNEETCCIFQIPEFILGMPTYNLPYCAAYIIFNLKNNGGFDVKFFNPNILLISWELEYPVFETTYSQPRLESAPRARNNNAITLNIETEPPQTRFRSVSDYKPTGNFIY